MWAGLAVLVALLWLDRGRVGLAAVGVVLAVGVKLFAALLVPMLHRRHHLAAIGVLAGAALLTIPAVTAGYGSGRLGGFGHYARRWQGNEGGFALVSAAMAGVVHVYAWFDDAPEGAVRLRWLAPALDLVARTPLDPWRGLVEEKKSIDDRTVFDRGVVVAYAARIVVLLGVAAMACVLARRADGWTAARWTLLGALLFAPQGTSLVPTLDPPARGDDRPQYGDGLVGGGSGRVRASRRSGCRCASGPNQA